MNKKSLNSNHKSPVEEISQQLMPLFAENALRVKLHPFHIPLAVTNAHNLLRFTPGCHLKAVRKRRGGNHQRMVARHR